jgi:phosphate transport system substrate-binding protein
MMVSRCRTWCLLILLFSLFGSCSSYKSKRDALPDTPDRGTIYVSADESFEPVIDEEIKVYESNFPGTHIIVSYKPEAECLKDLLNDSVRMIIVTRWYTPEEKRLVADSLKVGLYSMALARDAIALIMNPAVAEDSLTMKDVKDILQGKFRKKLNPVFDGVKATSTVRFIIDSVLHGDSLTRNTSAAKSSEGVIDYIANSDSAIGFIGYSWIGDRDDAKQQEFLKKVKVIPLRSTYRDGGYVKPDPYNIATGGYPLVRDLVYILKEKHHGLGNGFADFMTGQRGQLIFRRSYLVPAQLDFSVRKARLNDK